MTSLADIERGLPWGFHDARLEGLELDWPGARATLSMRLMFGERQERDRRCRVDITGLVYCSIDAPEIDPARGYEPTPADGLWVDAGDRELPDQRPVRPPTPAGCFVHWFFVQNWNRFIYVCGRDAVLTWKEPAEVPARGDTPALLPGDDVPDP
jgi:hypothetical protein